MQPCFRIQCLQIFKLYKLAVTWRLAISFDCWLDDSEWFGFSEHSAGRARCHCLAIFAVLSSSRSKGIENQGWQISGKHIHFDGRILFNDQEIMIPDTPLGLAGRINIIGCFAYFFILGLFMFDKLFGIFVNI